MSIDKEIERKIIKARVSLVLDFPFFGNLATRLIIKDGSGWIPTAGTDGKYLYYNKKFFESLDRAELEFVIGHEVLHCVYDHMTRRQGRDPKMWNCAADYVINLDLKDHRIGRIPKGIKCLLDEKYRDKSADEIYKLLMQDQKDGKGECDMDSFDTHIDGDGKSGAGEDDQSVKPDPTGKNGPIPMSDDEKRTLRDEIRQAVIQSAKACENAGQVPGSVRRMIEDMTAPKMNWREIITMKIQSNFKSDFTFSVPNRKTQHTGVILPGMYPDEKLDVDISIDTSGSISTQMLKDFLGEVKGIMEQYTDFKLRLWTFDTQVYGCAEFDPCNIDELLEYEPAGGGGTDFDVNWEFMKENNIMPHVFIMMTDGMPWNSWGDPDYCDTVFLIHGNSETVAPFGTTVYYD